MVVLLTPGNNQRPFVRRDRNSPNPPIRREDHLAGKGAGLVFPRIKVLIEKNPSSRRVLSKKERL
jgi:hypothetical protein